MDGDLGRVLVVDDAQLERVSVVRASFVVGSCSVRVHWLAVWSGFWMAVVSGACINIVGNQHVTQSTVNKRSLLVILVTCTYTVEHI
jgi:hypothetical protein